MISKYDIWVLGLDQEPHPPYYLQLDPEPQEESPEEIQINNDKHYDAQLNRRNADPEYIPF